MTSDTQKALDLSLLNDQLAQLFGFADGVSDVVEHLLTIDSKDDLSEYLEQLLGTSTSKQTTFQIFVENLIRYQRGQALIVEEAKAAPDAATLNSTNADAVVPNKKISPIHDKKVAAKTAPHAKKTGSINQKLPKKERPPPSNASNIKSDTSQAPSHPIKSAKQEKVQPTQQMGFRKLSSLPKPPQGDPQVKSCGCFGTQHDVTVNCLYCGRISCSAEANIVFCPHCRYQLPDKNDRVRIECVPVEALELKNKLLLRDKERTSQTKVYTDYMDQKSTWNSSQEAIAAQAQEQQREAELHQRQGIQLQIGL